MVCQCDKSEFRANKFIVFESFSTPESIPSLPHGSFDFGQQMFQTRCKTRVIDELIKTQSIEAFDGDVVNVGRRLQEGKVTSTRQLELELISVSKVRIDHRLCLLD